MLTNLSPPEKRFYTWLGVALAVGLLFNIIFSAESLELQIALSIALLGILIFPKRQFNIPVFTRFLSSGRAAIHNKIIIWSSIVGVLVVLGFILAIRYYI